MSIHYNPVKHGYVQCAHAWKWSSFHRLVWEGMYEAKWCCGSDQTPVQTPDFARLDTEGIELALGE